MSSKPDEEVILRKPSNRYYFMHRDYRQEDKISIQPIIGKFAETFGISYDSINISKRGNEVLFRVHSSERGEGDGYTTHVDLWMLIKWYELYVGKVIYKEKESL